MNINIDQKNTFGKNEVSNNKTVTNQHKVGFIVGVVTAVVVELIIRVIF